MAKKVILTYGTYDLITPGHIEHFKMCKDMGDYLIVGLSTDEFNKIKNKKSYLTYDERKYIVEAIRYVDKVIPEKEWDQKPKDIKEHNVDVVVMGSDWEGSERFESLRKYCDVMYTHRTMKWSSTDFRKAVDEYAKDRKQK